MSINRVRRVRFRRTASQNDLAKYSIAGKPGYAWVAPRSYGTRNARATAVR